VTLAKPLRESARKPLPPAPTCVSVFVRSSLGATRKACIGPARKAETLRVSEGQRLGISPELITPMTKKPPGTPPARGQRDSGTAGAQARSLAPRRQLAAAQGGHGGQRWRRKLRVEDVAAGVLHLPASHRASHEIAGDYIRIFLEASKMHAQVSAKARRPRPSLGPGGRHPFAHGHPAPFDASAHLPVRLVPVSAVLFLAVVSLVRHSANSDAIDRTGIRGAPVIQQPSRLRQDRASQGR